MAHWWLHIKFAASLSPRKRLVTVREGLDRNEARRLLHKHRIEKVLVVNKNFELRGLITAKDIQKATDKPLACKDSMGHLRVGAAVGAARGHNSKSSPGATASARCTRSGGIRSSSAS